MNLALLLYLQILLLVDHKELSDLFNSVDQPSLISECPMNVFVIIAQQVKPTDKTLYIQILRKMVLVSLNNTHNSHEFGLLSKLFSGKKNTKQKSLRIARLSCAQVMP